MKSHLISQVLLNRFSKNNRTRVHSKFSAQTYLIPPEDIGYVEIVDPLITKMEKKYGYIETRMATAFQMLDNGTILDDTKSVSSIKKFIALHYVRSVSSILMAGKTEGKFFDAVISEAIKENPQKEQEIRMNINSTREKWVKDLTPNLLKVIRNTLVKVDNYLDQYDLEIGLASNATYFTLGDIAVLNMTKSGKAGILQGVGITNSDNIAMPFGPKHLIALTAKGKSKKYIDLTDIQTGNANTKIIMNSFKEFYTLP